MNEPTPELNKALAKVQGELQTITKDKKANAGSYSYSYANLADSVAAAYPLMAKNGLSWSARPTFDENGQFVLVYSLRHESGEMLEGTYPLPTNGSPQQMGSAQTYARKYVFFALLGIATDDDDGQAAEQSYQHEGQGKKAEPVQGKKTAPAKSKKAEPVVDMTNMVERLQAEAPHKADELKAYWAKVAPGTKASAVPKAAAKALETKINDLVAEGKRADEPRVDPETGEVLEAKKDSPVNAAREALNATKGTETPEGWETN